MINVSSDTNVTQLLDPLRHTGVKIGPSS